MKEQIVRVLILFLSGPLNGYIQTIAVHPDWRCRGIGTRMIAQAEERIFRQSPNVFLSVSSFNMHAQELYERLGYQRVGELPDFVKEGFSEIPMRKTGGRCWGSSQASEQSAALWFGAIRPAPAMRRFGDRRSKENGEAVASS